MRATRGLFSELPARTESADSAALREKARREHRELCRDAAAIFSSPQGKNVLRRLRAAYVDSKMLHPDTVSLAARAAEHDLVMTIESWVLEGLGADTEADPDA